MKKGVILYPVRIGYQGALTRVNALVSNGHHVEALVSTVFTIEKTLRRTLRQLIVSAGFTSAMADKVIRNLRGLDAIKTGWELYDPHHRKLLDMISDAD